MKPQFEFGVYRILNLLNGKMYIGSSIRLTERLMEHRRELHAGTHFNKHLQASWKKYGEQSFSLEVILNCNYDATVFFEQQILDDIVATGTHVYNIAKTVDAPMKGIKHSAEIRAQIAAAGTGRRGPWSGKKQPREMVEKRMAPLRGENHWSFGIITKDHPNFGTKRSLETRQMLSDTKLGKRNPRYGKRGTFTGLTHSENARKRISAARRGTPWTPARRAAQGAQ